MLPSQALGSVRPRRQRSGNPILRLKNGLLPNTIQIFPLVAGFTIMSFDLTQTLNDGTSKEPTATSGCFASTAPASTIPQNRITIQNRITAFTFNLTIQNRHQRRAPTARTPSHSRGGLLRSKMVRVGDAPPQIVRQVWLRGATVPVRSRRAASRPSGATS